MKIPIRCILLIGTAWNYIRMHAAVSISGLCILVIGILWLIPMSWISPTRFYLTVSTEAVTMRFDSPEFWNEGCSLDTSMIKLQQMDKVTFRPAKLSMVNDDGDVWFQFRATKAILSELRLLRGTRLELSVNPDRMLTVSACGPGMSGVISTYGSGKYVGGRSLFVPSSSGPIDWPMPERIEFEAKGGYGDWGIVSASIRDSMHFSDLTVTELSFLTQDLLSPGNAIFKSGLNSGNLHLPQLGKTVLIYHGEPLRFDGLRARITEMSIGDKVELAVLGDADKILVGPEGFSLELTPTVLEYIYFNEKWFLLASAMVFLFSIVGSLRRR